MPITEPQYGVSRFLRTRGAHGCFTPGPVLGRVRKEEARWGHSAPPQGPDSSRSTEPHGPGPCEPQAAQRFPVSAAEAEPQLMARISREARF